MHVRSRGNQPLTRFDKESMVRQIEPYLKAGLSVRKACHLSGVSRTTLYKIMDEHQDLANQIMRSQMYLEIMTMGSIAKQLMVIANKQSDGFELSKDNLRFLMWFASSSRFTKEEFGKTPLTNTTVDPQIELLKLMKAIDSHCANEESQFV